MNRIGAIALVLTGLLGTVPTTARQATDEVRLGSVRLTQRVLADGKPLGPGTYEVRVSSTPATPVPPGETAPFERWAEFLQNNEMKGREVVTIVPANEIQQIAEEAPPPAGSYRVDVLKENNYVRVWFNQNGTHYLFHFPPA